jgi:hypothetical protein
MTRVSPFLVRRTAYDVQRTAADTDGGSVCGRGAALRSRCLLSENAADDFPLALDERGDTAIGQ